MTEATAAPIAADTAVPPQATRPRFFNYPSPVETNIPYKEPPKAGNPVVRGSVLVLGAKLVEKFRFVSKYLYGNAGFGELKKLKALEGIECRYDPAVIPIDPAGFQEVEKRWLDPEELRSPPARIKGEGLAKQGFYSVIDYHEAYKSGKFTPTDVINALLPLIRRDIDKPSRSRHHTAWLSHRVDLITAAAEASTQRYKEGKPLSAFDGVPVGIKDEVDIKGYKKCLGSNKDYSLKEEATSWCVAQWENVGAVVVGKTTMHEIGMDTTTLNPVHGTPLNPYNSGYYTGGSSGGSGYAVAAGLVPVALGVDGGGSIRIPSSFCGIYGLKPSHGRVSDRPTPDVANTVSCVGPMCVDMSSLEIAYQTIAQPDPEHRHSALFPAPRRLKDASSRTKLLGIPRGWYNRADASVKKICDDAIAYMTGNLGYKTVDIEIPLLYEGQLAHAVTILNEAYAGGSPDSRGRPDTKGLTAPNKILFAVGSNATATDFLKAQQVRQVLMSHLAFLYKKYPGIIIVTPTTPCAGWAIKNNPADLKHGCSDGDMSMRSMEYVWLANFCGCPAITLPAGYTEPKLGKGTKPKPEDSNVPVGLMGMGEWGSEDALIEFGFDGEEYLHKAYEGGRPRPGIWENVFGEVLKPAETEVKKSEPTVDGKDTQPVEEATNLPEPVAENGEVSEPATVAGEKTNEPAVESTK